MKKNDAATMDRILADDFMLATGSGKTYSKAELLEEASSSRVTYQHWPRQCEWGGDNVAAGGLDPHAQEGAACWEHSRRNAWNPPLRP